MTHSRWFPRAALALAVVGPATGCSLTPKTFRKVTDPAPIVRARSVGLGNDLPQGRVIPALIDRLEDENSVVRLAAFEQLKKKTGRSFGFVPWGDDAERARAVATWRAWWKERQAGLARFARKP